MKDRIQHFLQNIVVMVGCLLPYVVIGQQFETITNSPISARNSGSRSAAFVDVNNDGHMDVFISNGPRNGENNLLYINNGNGTFTAKTNDPLVQDGKPSDGATWGDIDNDGDLDVYVVNWYGQANLFYLNDGKGNFTQVKDGDIIQGGHSETASWADYDKDGDLDLYITNTSPNGAGQKNFLVVNNGDNRFTLNTSDVVVSSVRDSRNVNWVDIDSDNDLDLYLTNEGGKPNQLFLNNGSGGFTTVTSGSIVTSAKTSFGSSWADYDNDGDLDLFVANFGGNKSQLFQNDGKGNFTEIINSVINAVGGSVGSIWGDIDNDGDLDLFVTNSTFNSNKTQNFLYTNNGDGTFTKVTTGPVATYEGNSFGAAFGDYDNDGDLDLVTANNYQDAAKNSLYRNLGNTNHWVNISLKGVMSNTAAIGAKVRLKATIGGKIVWQMREISTQSGYNCQNSLRVHFGLGDATKIDSLIIDWPLGMQEKFSNVTVDKFHDFQEPLTKGFLRANFKVIDKLQYNIQEAVSFVNTSVTDPAETVTYSWDFDGDGKEDSSEKNPSFTYLKAGTYTVKLTITNNTGSKTIARTDYLRILDPSSIGIEAFPELRIYPNPYADYFSIDLKPYQLKKIKMYDGKGESVKIGKIIYNISGATISNKHLQSGTYILNITLKNGQSQAFRVVKK